MTESNEAEMKRAESSFDHTKQGLEMTISELNAKIARQETEHRSSISKIKDEHDRTLTSHMTREKDRTQSEMHDLQRSLGNKHEYELDSIRRKLTNQNQDLEDKNRKLELEIERLQKRETDLIHEIDVLKRQNRQNLESLKDKLSSESITNLDKLEKKLTERFDGEIAKVREEKKSVEMDLELSESKLVDIKTKFVLLEEQLQKLEQRTINSIEKTSFKLVKALGVSDPRTEKSENVSAALEYLRWTAKETINMISTNQTLVLDICGKWKAFEKEKNQEVKKLRHRFDTETDNLIEFSKQEIGDSYRQNLAAFRPIHPDD